MLADMLEEEMAASLPSAAIAMFRVLLDLLADLDERIASLDKEIERRAREDETTRRLTTIPGIGPLNATALTALAPPAETFAKGRDIAAWLGLTPLQRSTRRQSVHTCLCREVSMLAISSLDQLR